MKIVNENLANLRPRPFPMFLDERIFFRYIQMFLDIEEFQMSLDRFRQIQIVVLKQAGQEIRLLHFSLRSRDQLKAHVLIYHHLLPSPALSCIECSADKILHAVWNCSCFANWYDRQLSENRFHWEHVKHLVIRQAFINDAGTAGQEPLCAKHLKLE